MDNKSTHQISYAIGYRIGKKQCKKKELIDKACKWLLDQKEMIGVSFHEDFIERFRQAMKE